MNCSWNCFTKGRSRGCIIYSGHRVPRSDICGCCAGLAAHVPKAASEADAHPSLLRRSTGWRWHSCAFFLCRARSHHLLGVCIHVPFIGGLPVKSCELSESAGQTGVLFHSERAPDLEWLLLVGGWGQEMASGLPVCLSVFRLRFPFSFLASFSIIMFISVPLYSVERTPCAVWTFSAVRWRYDGLGSSGCSFDLSVSLPRCPFKSEEYNSGWFKAPRTWPGT